MKRNFNQKFTDLDGSEIDDSPTMAHTAIRLLLEQHASEPNLSGGDKIRRYELARSIHRAQGPIEISIEDSAMLKDLTARYSPPLVVAQFAEMLETDIQAA